MVRIRVRDKSEKVAAPDGLARQSTRKRKLGESADNGKSNGVASRGATVVSRSSKRTRTTKMPYQSPESVNILISAVAKGKKAAAKDKNESTPKRSVKQKREVSKAPKRPEKPLKRLQRQASPGKIAAKPPLRRKLMKSPEPVKPKKQAANARANKAKIAKKLEKVGKIVTKAKATITKTNRGKGTVQQKRKISPKDNQDGSPMAAKTAKKAEKKSKRGKGKLVPNPNLTSYEKDPMFESKAEIPFISTLSHSRLLIRAVILNDMKMLKKLVTSEMDKIYSLCIPRSVSHEETIFDYICRYENKEAYKILDSIPEKTVQKFGSTPTVMISHEGTGTPSHMMFGHAMRQVAVGRGGMEGNNAFLHDIHNSYHCISSFGCMGSSSMLERAIKLQTSMDFIVFLREKLKAQRWDSTEPHIALRMGNYEVLGKIIAQENERGGYGFNFLHEEAVTKTDASSLTEFKPVSVTKKCTYNPRFTPLHCAAINPNQEILAELLSSMPDYNLVDKDMWTVGHYAAVCSGPGPLKHLLQCGISTHAVTAAKRGGEGYTLLHAAVATGRAHNVKLILEHEKKAEISRNANGDGDGDSGDPKDAKRKQKILLQNDIRYKPSAAGKNALQMACELGHTEIVRLLLDAETDANKKTPAKQDSVTPMMLAAMHGHLDIVKMLVEAEVKVDDKDKRGRTAVHHAAMNGQTHVMSYLLRLGSNPLAVDSSGNSILHYSTAYGWYFPTMLALEAGCPPNAPNTWKMTPMAIAFMKGHIGLVTMLMKQDGVDVNARVDDATGKTLLLETCSAGWDLARLKFLVEELKADVNCEDFNGNNALHYLTTQTLEARYNDFPEKSKAFYDCLTYLVQKGCNPFKKNKDEVSPILRAAEKNNFFFISKLLDIFVGLNIRIPYEKNKSGDTILHHMSTHFNSYDTIIYPTFTKLVSNNANSTTLKEMAATSNKNGVTPLLKLLQNITSGDDEHQTKVQNMVEVYLEKLGVSPNTKIEGKDKSQQSLLHLTVGTYLLKAILKYKPYLEAVDDKSRTPLAQAVLNGQKDAAVVLIEAGANVNIRFKDEFNVSLLLHTVMKENSSFSLVPKLIEKGADPREVHPRTKNSVLHYIARKPALHHAFESLRVVLEAGASPNMINCDGQTPLHLVVNARGKETDVFYDIEDALISAGVDLSIKDHRGRIALHYCFVKRGNPLDSSFFDPIELVSHLVTAMKSSGTEIFIRYADTYGSTPLHYAAFRGATICSSYLMQRLPQASIEVRDGCGNTPFGLAVRGSHEGCALNFFQKDCDFLHTINNDIKVKEIKKFELAASSSGPGTPKREWKWKHIQEREDQKEILSQQALKYPILEQVVKNDWQGLLHLIIGKLQDSGKGFTCGISTALKLNRLKMALKISMKVRDKKDLTFESGTLFHTFAKHHTGSDMDLSKKIYVTFRKTGLHPATTDEFGSHPVIYALNNRQISFCEVLYGSSKDPACFKILAAMKPDQFGRTPLTALFWNVKLSSSLTPQVEKFATELIAAGAYPSQLCEYPIKLSSLPGVRYAEKLIDISPTPNGTRYPPIVLAVIVGSYATVKWLLTMKVPGKVVDVNANDSEGRTAIMHAVRLNDMKMVKLLLDPHCYKNAEDYHKLAKIKIKSSNVLLTNRDKKGWTVADHLVASPGPSYHYKDIQQIFQLLHQCCGGDSKTFASNVMATAIKHGRHDLIDTLAKYTTTPTDYKKPVKADQHSLSASVFSQDITLMPIKDYQSVAEKMAEKLIEQEREKLKKEGKDEVEKPKPDKLCGLEKDNAELIMDESQNIPYDALMTKVDMNYGIHGLYNFYKMQLIKQPRGKKMILLFTEWGRVGQQGQYQKTPFVTEEEAIKEFTKIFKQKSGNGWEDLKNFTALPGKYRMVPRDLRSIKHFSQVGVDFKELEKAGKNVTSSLPKSILKLMNNLSGVHTDAAGAYSGGRYRYRNPNYSSPDYRDLPLLPTDILLKAEGILKSIGELLKKNAVMKDDNTGKYTEKDKTGALDEVTKLSEQFYQEVPVYGFATQNLMPIFDEDDLREKILVIHRLLHLEAAKSILLASQYHMSSINPYEHVYRCLDTKIQLLNRSSKRDQEEAELILQYIHNSGSKAKVSGIYRVDIPQERERLKSNTKATQNRQLLWHGTSAANILSILQNGLQVAPLTSQISGHLFGKGIYLADIFEKSQHYCRTVTVNGKARKYMLLCEAALGKTYEVKLQDASTKPMPASYDSLKTSDSRYLPDPDSTIMWKAQTVALGRKVSKPEKQSDGSWIYYGLDFNEYIVFNPDQVAVRYLIEFDDSGQNNDDEEEEDEEEASNEEESNDEGDDDD